ncbi:MAG: ABC transporter ATP-binding protein [Bacillota bacterium]|nr:ABC transporter ATP-binding protein [Bacillota bacterium]
MTTLVDLKEIYKIYSNGEGENDIHALDGISLQVHKGEFVAIVGSSGSGKSTCMNIIGCLDTPTSGNYFLNGIDVSTMGERELAHIRNKQIGFIFQQYNLIPKLTVLENVELPLIYRGIGASERKRITLNSLERVGLSDRANKFPNQLSGGQQQRVSIARALAGEPPVILADEPTGALDSKTGKEVLDFLKKLNGEGTTIILITHDNGIASQISRVVRIHDGKIISDEAKEVISVK